LFKDEATKRVRLGLIVGEIINHQDMKADDDRIRKMIEEIAAPYQEPQAVIDWYYGNEKQLEQIKYVVLEEQVIDTVLEAATVTTKVCTYDEAIRPAEEGSKEKASVKEGDEESLESNVDEEPAMEASTAEEITEDALKDEAVEKEISEEASKEAKSDGTN